MTTFIFSLDRKAPLMQEAVIRAGLKARFPSLQFEYDAEIIEGLENSIVSIPEDVRAARRAVKTASPDLVAEVRTAFGDLLRQARAICQTVSHRPLL